MYDSQFEGIERMHNADLGTTLHLSPCYISPSIISGNLMTIAPTF